MKNNFYQDTIYKMLLNKLITKNSISSFNILEKLMFNNILYKNLYFYALLKTIIDKYELTNVIIFFILS